MADGREQVFEVVVPERVGTSVLRPVDGSPALVVLAFAVEGLVVQYGLELEVARQVRDAVAQAVLDVRTEGESSG